MSLHRETGRGIETIELEEARTLEELALVFLKASYADNSHMATLLAGMTLKIRDLENRLYWMEEKERHRNKVRTS